MTTVLKLYQFLFQGDFLQNLRHIDFGIRHCGTTVGDVDLPPWAENHSDFVEKLSQAMESDYVSRYILTYYVVESLPKKIWHYLQSLGGSKKIVKLNIPHISRVFFVSYIICT